MNIHWRLIAIDFLAGARDALRGLLVLHRLDNNSNRSKYAEEKSGEIGE
jgi:hypothetical protein